MTFGPQHAPGKTPDMKLAYCRKWIERHQQGIADIRAGNWNAKGSAYGTPEEHIEHHEKRIAEWLVHIMRIMEE